MNVYWLKAQGILEVAVLARNVSLIRSLYSFVLDLLL